MAVPLYFGIIPTGCPVIMSPSSTPSPTSFVYNLSPKQFSHIVVFLLPNTTLPPDAAAAVYLAAPPQAPGSNAAPDFKFLGGLGPGKESAIFKVRNSTARSSDSAIDSSGEVDMDAHDLSPHVQSLILGISIESSSSVSTQMAALAVRPSIPTINEPTNAYALVLSRPGEGKPDTLVLARRIIKNAFNFLASFADAGGRVPLRQFENWWGKFEGRIRSDPRFLENEVD